MIRVAVDTAFLMVVGLSIDDTDFKTPETAIAHTAVSDFSIIQNAVNTAITPTSSGANDWTHIAGSYYSIQITAGNNDTTGHLFGRCTASGVLPMESIHYEVVSAAEYALSVEGARFLNEGTLQAATSTTATLATSASALADFVNDGVLVIYAGTGAGQHRLILDYAVTTRVATVEAWVTTPDSTSKYYILPLGLSGMTSAEVQTAANAALVTLELDHLAAVAATGADVADDSIVAKMVSASATADFDDFDNTNHSLEALSNGIAGVGTAGGASISIDANTSNEGGGITGVTSATTIIGTPTNTYTSTSILDGVYHIMTHAANAIDVVYQFLTGGGTEPVSVVWTGYLTSANDTVTISAWDHVGGAWETVGSIPGTGGSSNSVVNPVLFTRHRGTSAAELGKVYVRLHCTAQTSPVLNTDQLYIEYAITSRSVGYAMGAVWVDTVAGTAGTESFVNGTADNKVLTFADAITIANAVGLDAFEMSPDAAITLVATINSRILSGSGWTLALGGQNIDDIHVFGAGVSGIGTSATRCGFHDCKFTTASIQKAFVENSTFNGTVTMTLAGDYNFVNCQSAVAGASAPTFAKTAGQAITAQWRRWSGGITLSGLEVGDTLTISGELGTVDLGSPAGAVAVEIRGTYKDISNVGSASVNLDGAILAADVAAIKTKTGQLTFTKANEVDANTQSINDATVVGDGNATPWDGA